MIDWNRIADRHGVLTLADAQANGITDSRWSRSLGCGDLLAVHQAVAVVPTAPRTQAQVIAAAVRSLGPGALACIDRRSICGPAPNMTALSTSSWPAAGRVTDKIRAALAWRTLT